MLDAGALERDRWELLDIQEVLRLQVAVALLVMRAQRAGVDGGLDGGGGEIIFVEVDHGLHARDLSLHGHDAHVLGGKLHLGVHWIHGPAHRHSPFPVVAYTTIPIATVCQGTFYSATTVLRFECVDLGCGGPVSVRSEHS